MYLFNKLSIYLTCIMVAAGTSAFYRLPFNGFKGGSGTNVKVTACTYCRLMGLRAVTRHM